MIKYFTGKSKHNFQLPNGTVICSDSLKSLIKEAPAHMKENTKKQVFVSAYLQWKKPS